MLMHFLLRWGAMACATLWLAACAAAPTLTPTQPAPTLTASVAVTQATSAPLANTAIPAPLATATLAPTASATASPTPTAPPKGQPTLGYYNITPAPDATLVTPFPTPLSAIPLDQDLVNILLIGTDYRAAEKNFRTDTLIIASIHKDSGQVTLLSIPRDLFVYVPTWGMQRINKAYADGESSQYPGGGPGLLIQTILYNLGVPVHYYALVNFDGFRQIVDTVGGIDVPVMCELTEYKIKDLALDETDPANYELYTQPQGVAHMDGALALWYARARPVGGDFYRAYRQRQVLRAIYHAALSANLLPKIPELYGHYQDIVQSDLGLWDIMPLAPLAAKVGDAQLRSLHIGPNQVTAWTTPRGEDVLLPKPDAIQALVNQAFAPANTNQLARAVTPIEIWNTTAHADWAALAAEALANEGFAPIIATPDGTPAASTTLMDFTTSAKGSPVKKLQTLFHLADAGVVAQPNADNPAPFRIILADDYNPCPRLDWMPDAEATPAP